MQSIVVDSLPHHVRLVRSLIASPPSTPFRGCCGSKLLSSSSSWSRQLLENAGASGRRHGDPPAAPSTSVARGGIGGGGSSSRANAATARSRRRSIGRRDGGAGPSHLPGVTCRLDLPHPSTAVAGAGASAIRCTSTSVSASVRVNVPQAGGGGGGKKRGRERGGRRRRRGGGGQRHGAAYKFVDRARLRVRGGDGGKGCVSYERLGRGGKRRPNGGNGGHGGYVVLVADPREQTLAMDGRRHREGRAGGNGGSNVRHGANGADEVVRVPCGVVVRRVLDYGEGWDEEEGRVIPPVVVADDDGSARPFVADSFASANLEGVDDSNADDEDDDDDTSVEATNESDDWWESSDDEEEDGSDEEDETEGGFESRDAAIGGEGDDDDGWRRGADGLYDTGGLTNVGIDDDNEEDRYRFPFPAAEDRERVVLADLDRPGSYVVVASGGRGGTGNHVLARRRKFFSPRRSSAPFSRSVPASGESAHLELELKLIADVGLVGFPNAGKSSLLAAMSKAKPRIAPYPFTTLHPLVGCIEYRDGFRVVAADIPGLVEGASAGRGRGHDFLRHLERTGALLYVVDVAGTDGRDPADDLRTLADELAEYGDGELLSRPSVVVANKVDLLSSTRDDDDDRRLLESKLLDVGIAAEEAGIGGDGGGVIGISAGVTGEGLAALSKVIRSVVVRVEAEKREAEKRAVGEEGTDVPGDVAGSA